MRILIVYDASINLQWLPWPLFKRGDEVFLFPLTSVTSIVDHLRGLARDQGVDVQVLETAQLINKSAENLRGPYLDFIGNIALDARHNGKNLREWFAVDRTASLWWMSLVAEKNTFKSDAFNKLAQADAVIETIHRLKIQSVYVAIDTPRLAETLKRFLAKEKISCVFWPAKRKGVRKFLKEYPRFHFAKHFLHLLVFAASFFRQARKIRGALKPCRRTLIDPHQIMLISAFPYLDAGLAQKGIFRNRLYAQLQDVLEEKKEKILWAAFYVKNEAVSFEQALEMAKKFNAQGYNIYFIEEACTWGMQLKALAKLFLQSIKFLSAQKSIAFRHRWKGYDFYPVLKDDWYRSFVGPEGYQSLLFYFLFQDLLRRAKARKGMYCCEMQSWEKALLFARAKTGSDLPLLAYQHATVSRMLLNYFNTPTEMHTNGRYGFAVPDVLICNGPIPCEYMRQSGWKQERLVMAEAVRFSELAKAADEGGPSKKNVVLIAFSIGTEESRALLRMSHEAFKDKDIEVWLKPHPFVEVDKVFALAGLKKEECPFKIKNEPIEELLKQAKVVVVGESSVSIQALSLGCEVAVVHTPEWINMSPLSGIEDKRIKAVYAADELQSYVRQRLNAAAAETASSPEKIVDRFFYFGKDPGRPEILLTLLGL